MSIFKLFKEKVSFKTNRTGNYSEMKNNSAVKCYSGIKIHSEPKVDISQLISRRDYFSASIVERVIAENKAEKEAKEAIQKRIDMEWKMKSGGCSEY